MMLSGVHNVSQIGFAASSSDLNSKSQLPYYGRTIPSSTNSDAKTVVAYLQKYKVTKLNVLFVTEAFGSAYQNALQDAAGAVGIETISHLFLFSSNGSNTNGDSEDISNNINNRERKRRSKIVLDGISNLIEEENDDNEISSALRALNEMQF
eukprot:12991922-Ditylum_brightwellii.AAC.1